MKENSSKFIFQKDFWLGLVLILIFFSHYILMGQNSIWYANDYAELIIHWYTLLIEQDGLWKANEYPISGMLDTLPRGSFASEFFLKTWLFYFFKPYTAIVINKLLIHVLAYLAAYHFLEHFLPKESRKLIPYYALIWAVIPFWPEAGIGLAFTPSLFLVFYSLQKGERFSLLHVLVIGLYCFYSSLNLNGLFVAFALFFYGLAGFYQSGKMRWKFWLALAGFTLLFCIFNFRLFDIYYFQRDWFVPHRVEYDIYSFVRYHDNILLRYVEILFLGNIHAGYVVPLFYIILLGFLAMQLFSIEKSALFHPLMKVFVAINFVALFAAMITFRPWVEQIPALLLIRQFTIDRFYFLIYPLMVFSVIFVLDWLWNLKKRKTLTGILIFIFVVYPLIALDNNAKNYLLKPILGTGEKYPTYREFFAEDQFQQIKNFLQEQSPYGFKVASLGFHPAISSFNGMQAIDGYTMNYPLAYKDDLYEVIKEELGSTDRENWLYWHFKGWGNKAYLFNQTHKDDFMRMKWLESKVIYHPKYNYEKMKALGCRFILSIDPVIDEQHLEFLKKSEHPQSAWNIHIYKIK
ncbi:DUF6044 family protein [Mongoliibacter ruber]|uniref:Glycosyltransferase RgtA/B/C/D-like domain-containing protein n=1 Tax=Mongoliibacter ruber TaxID=1750599 RepID=A0A2T0WG44_9BACT|nr:DUF6044 family protein [Mongoliibacter ruber]PRY85683.1 hypothetical protein CLW00_11125 [Mongoliibacter ruber]